MVVFRTHRTFFVFLKCTTQGGSKVDVLLIAFLHLWLKFCKGIDKYWTVPLRKLFYFHHWKGTKKFVFNCIWTSGKGGSQLVCCTVLISQLSLNVFVIWELSIQYNSQIFVLVNIFYVLTTQFQQWSGCAFCTLNLKRHTNSFVAVENNPMWFCIRLAHI